MTALNQFDAILYINLDKRKDRKKKLHQEFVKLCIDPLKINRIEGHYDELNGSRGCVLSHIKALDFALSQQWDNVLILEDDCLFIKNGDLINSYIRDFFHHFKKQWDVFFLGTQIHCSTPTTCEHYVQVRFSLRAHAYAVNRPYMQKLRDHFFSTYKSMKMDLFFIDSQAKALDRRWVELQLSDRWYAGKKMIARQSSSFSDIEKRIKPLR